MIINHNNAQKVHIHFGGCGGSYSYLLGLAYYLQSNYDLSNVIFSGISAGNIMCLLCILNKDIEEMHRLINIPLLLKLQNYKLKAFCNFIPEIKLILLEILNEDKNNYKLVNGRLFVNLTHIPSFRNEIISEFYSNEDLVDCVLASSHIPFYNTSLFYTFRNKYYIDGYISSDSSFVNCYLGKNYITLKFNITTFRELENHFLLISTCDNLSCKLFKYGYTDIEENIIKYHQF
jgi:hypothetical protein